MSQYLLQNSLQLSTGVREDECNAIETQSEKKREKQTLLKNCLEGATKKYIDKIHHCDMFESVACLKTCAQIDNELRKITSISGRKEAMRDQIIIRLLGLGWDDWHHPWYSAGHYFIGDELVEHIRKLMKRYKKINISAKPPVDMPTIRKLTVLSTISPDIIRLYAKKAAKEGKLIEAAEVLKNNYCIMALGIKMRIYTNEVLQI